MFETVTFVFVTSVSNCRILSYDFFFLFCSVRRLSHETMSKSGWFDVRRGFKDGERSSLHEMIGIFILMSIDRVGWRKHLTLNFLAAFAVQCGGPLEMKGNGLQTPVVFDQRQLDYQDHVK